ncbi:MAG: OFA family MFS transporter [candidate division NC10 bacterium]|nr:OFA family MFS transporter [candidate division NC10 bacterium]
MAEERLPNRWMFVVWALIMQLCLGNLYTWSIFRTPLMKAYGWTIQQATWPFTLSVVFFAVGMVFAGRWQDKAGPKIVAITGGIILGAGFLLASVVGNTLAGIYIAYGVLGGLGVGFAYVTPIAVCVKWFPDMRGFITGLAVLGFGAGSMIGAPVGTTLIGRIGPLGTYAVFGIVFGILVALAGSQLKNPPAGYRPAGWSPPAPAAGKPAVTKYDYAPTEMVKTPQFWLLWFIYLFGAGVGLMVISQAVPMGVELTKATAAVAAAALGTMAIFNGLGRPAFGAISDKIGRSNATMLAFALYIVALLAVLRGADSIALYTVGISMVGFAYGGYLALMPSYTADYFGTKNLGINYGWVFSAWGAAGVLGPIIGAQVRAVTGAWTTAFWILSGLCVAGILLALITKAPAAREVEAPAKA